MLKSVVLRALEKSTNTDNVISPHLLLYQYRLSFLKVNLLWKCSSDIQIDIII